jgi:hypothetical protein
MEARGEVGEEVWPTLGETWWRRWYCNHGLDDDVPKQNVKNDVWEVSALFPVRQQPVWLSELVGWTIQGVDNNPYCRNHF